MLYISLPLDKRFCLTYTIYYMTDPLDLIFTNENEVDKQILADILSPYVKINVDDNSIYFTPAGNSLPITGRLLVFLLGRKALKLREKIEIEGISPSDIIDGTHLKEGSVHPGLKTLRDKGLVVVKESKYFVPNHKIGSIRDFIMRKE